MSHGKWRCEECVSCKACGDRAKDHPGKGRVVNGRSTADYCNTCFLELTEGKICYGGTVSFFDSSGYEHLSEGQRHGRRHTDC